jgi:4'-phosphopantetheinyl transferase EntD
VSVTACSLQELAAAGGPDPLMAAIGALLPVGATCAGGAIAGVSGPLYAQELAYVASAVPRRRQEFCAGRVYARRALLQLSVPAQPIPASPSRAPQWPHGHVGSISHSGQVCAAIAGRQADYLGLGLDLEADDALDAELAALVCTPAELAWIREGGGIAGIDLPKLVFVIKEAVYKLYWPLVNHFLDFGDLSVRLGAAAGTFTATLSAACPDACDSRSFDGHFTAVGRYLCAVSALPNPDRPGLRHAITSQEFLCANHRHCHE